MVSGMADLGTLGGTGSQAWGVNNVGQVVGGSGTASGVYHAVLWKIPPALDVDGEGRTDRTIFRPSTGVWFAALSGGGATATMWGVATDVDVMADYDGDGRADIAVWRPSTGEWWIRQSKTGTFRVDTWGVPGDVPLAGDVDGDRQADLVIYRPSTGQWWAKLSTGGFITETWGISADVPLLGDFDGDGKADFAIYRPNTGEWWIALQTGGTRVVTGARQRTFRFTLIGMATGRPMRPSTGRARASGGSGCRRERSSCSGVCRETSRSLATGMAMDAATSLSGARPRGCGSRSIRPATRPRSSGA